MYNYIVKYNKKTQDIRCKCGGEVWVDGTASLKLPVGVGDLGQVSAKHVGQFGVSVLNYKGYYGTCFKCRKTVFAYSSKRLSHKQIKVKAS